MLEVEHQAALADKDEKIRQLEQQLNSKLGSPGDDTNNNDTSVSSVGKKIWSPGMEESPEVEGSLEDPLVLNNRITSLESANTVLRDEVVALEKDLLKKSEELLRT